MSSTDESIRYMGENLGEDLFEATSRKSGSNLPSYVGGRKWSLCQAVHRLMDESSEEEEEDSSHGEINLFIGRTEYCQGPVVSTLGFGLDCMLS
ncbi:UNVERIFIED_CONTAM: hypothetical protein Sradi_1744800 [Sesamum radiatum]|uniref:Uncharacterized protein n=1 Tax=Sesamum radiatum TaxID=300843 RepID=A0AAW2TUA5_SESRA